MSAITIMLIILVALLAGMEGILDEDVYKRQVLVFVFCVLLG